MIYGSGFYAALVSFNFQTVCLRLFMAGSPVGPGLAGLMLMFAAAVLADYMAETWKKQNWIPEEAGVFIGREL